MTAKTGYVTKPGYAGYATRHEALRQFKCVKCDKDKQ